MYTFSYPDLDRAKFTTDVALNYLHPILDASSARHGFAYLYSDSVKLFNLW